MVSPLYRFLPPRQYLPDRRETQPGTYYAHATGAESIAVFQSFRAAVNAGDEEGALSVLAPEVEFVRIGQTMRGIDEVRPQKVAAQAGSKSMSRFSSSRGAAPDRR
jgi:hypothetical protein